jgi:hypothetical protein
VLKKSVLAVAEEGKRIPISRKTFVGHSSAKFFREKLPDRRIKCQYEIRHSELRHRRGAYPAYFLFGLVSEDPA